MRLESKRHRIAENITWNKHVVAAGWLTWDVGSIPTASTIFLPTNSFRESKHRGSLPSAFGFVPRHFREQQSHTAEIRDAREDQTRADEAGEPDEMGIHKLREQDSGENNRARRKPNLFLVSSTDRNWPQ